MFKYLSSTPALPPRHALKHLPPPPSFFFFSSASPSVRTDAAADLQPGWVGGMQVQAGERGGEPSIVGLDSTLSPLEHPRMGEPTDNHAS